MANRSYLYSTNIIPSSNISKEEPKLIGISEWPYDIPIVYQLLLSGKPIACKSNIWEEGFAIVGDYAMGFEALKAFMQKIELPEAQPLILETLEFLSNPENKNKYFILECSEIFDMDEEDTIQEQNLALLEKIKHLEPNVENALNSLQPKPPKPAGFFSKLFGVKPKQTEATARQMEAIYSLGFAWENILYFGFTNA